MLLYLILSLLDVVYCLVLHILDLLHQSSFLILLEIRLLSLALMQHLIIIFLLIDSIILSLTIPLSLRPLASLGLLLPSLGLLLTLPNYFLSSCL